MLLVFSYAFGKMKFTDMNILFLLPTLVIFSFFSGDKHSASTSSNSSNSLEISSSKPRINKAEIAPSIDPLPLGAKTPLPDYKMKNIDLKRISQNDAKDRNGLLVMFSCNTCPYVIKNQERTLKIAQWAKENKIGVLLVNSNEASRDKDDSFEAMKAYAAEQGYTFYYVIDEGSKLANAFGASRTPEVFLFNKSAELVYTGAIDDSPADPENIQRNHLQIAMQQMVDGDPVSVPKSRSIGCGIKFVKG